jgi:hypothetical protein
MTNIKVAFWNVHNLFDTTASPIATDLEFIPEQGWTEEVFAIKVANLATIIKQMHGGAGPDLLALCEVETREVVEERMAQIGRSDYRLALVDSPGIRGIDCFYDLFKPNLQRSITDGYSWLFGLFPLSNTRHLPGLA